VKLLELLHKSKDNLDEFNLEVAKYRVRNGMSPELVLLYSRMGRLSKLYNHIESHLEDLYRLDILTGEQFEKMLLKEDTDEREDSTGRG
jgi:hypothetical protein